MDAPISKAGNNLVPKLNVACLLLAVLFILILPLKKEIWYDETVSMLCSKGISSDAPAEYASTNSLSSETINALNSSQNVFRATVVDNGNSFLYNYKLHWFTLLFGNSINSYMLLSKLCAVISLLAFFVLCRFFFHGSLFTSVAVLFLVTDNNFIGMSHEIRAYSMGIMFILLAAICFYRFLSGSRPIYLFFTGLFSAFAILSHYLSIYVIAFFIIVLLATRLRSLVAVRNLAAIFVPVALLAIYFYYAAPGLAGMRIQNRAIQEIFSTHTFSISEVFFRSARIMAINYKFVFPAFMDSHLLSVVSFALLIILYVVALRVSQGKPERCNLHLLFLPGVLGSLFMAALSIRAHHYTALYFRYFSFCLPFCSLFTAYALYVLCNAPRLGKMIRPCLTACLLIPSVAFAVVVNRRANPPVKYNHATVASAVLRDNVSKISVPQWKDAFLLQALLPSGHKIDYFRDSLSHSFVLFKGTGTDTIRVLRDDR